MDSRNNKRNRKRTIRANVALRRCLRCEWINVGREAGKCLFRRVDRVYPPITEVVECPMGRKI